MEEESWRRRTLVKELLLQSDKHPLKNERENLFI